MRVVVIGGGVMGCASALELAARGARVIVLERSVPGAEASSAAAGVLGAQIEAKEGSPMIDTFARARAAYAGWARELREGTGIDIGHRVSGLLSIAVEDEEERELARAVAWQRAQGLRAELVGEEEARRIEPELGRGFRAAAHYPDEAQVDPPSLLRALVAAVAKAGVEVRTGATVQNLLVEGGRCVGAALDGAPLRADATVLAAGSWSTLVPGVPESVPRVRPIRGQIVQLEQRPPRVASMVVGPGGAYLVPRGDGRVVCGSTMESVGFQRGVTAGGVHTILSGVLRVVPSLSSAEIGATWSSFRPFAGEETTWLVGASALPGLFLATGHHRNGILLAKATAERVAQAVFAAA
jgi:glycine oxidase